MEVDMINFIFVLNLTDNNKEKPYSKKMLSEKQEKINTDLLDEYEQEVEAQKSKFEEHLRFSVDSALEYKCS